MTSNKFSGKKQRKLTRFSEFVARRSGKDRAGLLAEEVIEGGSITAAMFTLIDGSAPYEDRKQTIDRAFSNCLSLSEGGQQVVVMAMAMG
jgi:hypothetical protein